MQNKPSTTWIPSPKLVNRILIIVIVLLALSTGYFATLAQTSKGNTIKILKYLDVNNTKELLNTQWERK